jgi:hypothetical protein
MWRLVEPSVYQAGLWELMGSSTVSGHDLNQRRGDERGRITLAGWEESGYAEKRLVALTALSSPREDFSWALKLALCCPKAVPRRRVAN